MDRLFAAASEGAVVADKAEMERASAASAKELEAALMLVSELVAAGLPLSAETEVKPAPEEPREHKQGTGSRGVGGSTDVYVVPPEPLYLMLEWAGSGLVGGVAWATVQLLVSKWRRRNV